MSAEWKDISSYGRGDTRREPHSFEMEAGHLRLVVTRSINLAPTDWKVISVGPDVVLGGNRSADDAKAWATRHAVVRLRSALLALGDETVRIGGAP